MFRVILCSSSGGQNCIFTASGIVNLCNRPYSAPVESGQSEKPALKTKLYDVTYQKTLYDSVFLEKLTGPQLFQEILRILLDPNFIAAFTAVHHLPLAQTKSVQPTSHPTSWRPILILFSNLRLGVPSCIFQWGHPNKTLFAPNLKTVSWKLSLLQIYRHP
jgi:hypothetical protein